MNLTSELERHSAASSTHRSWNFLRHGAGILPASNMADPLRGSNLGPGDLLVREAVQNSLDERRVDSDGPVRIRFERRVLTGSDKRRLVDALELSVLADRRRTSEGRTTGTGTETRSSPRSRNPRPRFRSWPSPTSIRTDSADTGTGRYRDRTGSSTWCSPSAAVSSGKAKRRTKRTPCVRSGRTATARWSSH